MGGALGRPRLALGLPDRARPRDPLLDVAVPNDPAADLPGGLLRRLYDRAGRALGPLLHPAHHPARRLGGRADRRPPRVGATVLMAAGAPSALPYVSWSS